MGRSSRTPGVYQTAEGSYEVDSWYNKRRIRQRGFASFFEAENYLIKFKEQLRNTMILGERPAITLEHAAAHYIQVEDARKKISLETEHYLLKPVIKICGDLTLDMVSNQTLRKFVDMRLAEGCKHKSINNSLAIVRRICKLAAADWRLDNGKTWLATAPLITMLDLSDQRLPRPLSWGEQGRLLQALPEHLYQMALFDLNTGARTTVICQLRWDWEVQVKIGEGLVVSVFVVPKSYVKGRRSERILVCNTAAQSIIDEQRGKHQERVFTFQGKPLNSMNNTAWQSARKRAGLDDLHVHDLRHTVGMRLREAGVSERTQDEILWHTNKRMTTHYAAAQVRELYNALEIIKEPSGQESINILELVRRVPQKSPRSK